MAWHGKAPACPRCTALSRPVSCQHAGAQAQAVPGERSQQVGQADLSPGKQKYNKKARFLQYVKIHAKSVNGAAPAL